MLSDNIWPLSAFVPFELHQSINEGKITEVMKDKLAVFNEIKAGDTEKENMAGAIMKELQGLPVRNDFPFKEPSVLEEIRNERPGTVKYPGFDMSTMDDSKLFDRIYGAWLGRCVGCLLGQPVEFWHRERFNGLLKDTDNYPIKYYVSSAIDDEIRKKYDVRDQAWIYGVATASWINNIKHMPEDDDINYVILALKLLEHEGAKFTPESVAGRWIMDLPFLHTFTAERIAYANIVNGVFPPESAIYRNPCREWIGAQIRGDFYGWINPGNPEFAAEMAWRDASISHTKNGIYGEMFISAMLAATVFTNNAEELIQYGLSQIPEKSRFTEAVNSVVTWKKQGLDWEQAIDRIHELYNEKEEYDSLYVLPNAMVVCTGLIYGEMDFEKSIGIAVTGSFDRDCNGATVGSIVGLVLGASALPEKWIKPLNDTVKSGIDGFGMEKISDLAHRTVKITKKLMGE